MASPHNPLPGDTLHTYEPADLDDMTQLHAVDAVIADLRDHRITVDRTGLFNATRHIGLLCHLTTRMASDAQYQISSTVDGVLPAEDLAAGAGHLGRAIAHYTLAFAPLTALTQLGTQAALQQQVDAIDHHSQLRVHLGDAGRALAAAVAKGSSVPRRS
ncbi:hypothetical protein [Streptomyces sp. SID13726]|uniref:hypothetical protein n=1 Tax=Streptomyces sp. SID13726 TaxID=2706058 RepID=UPI0013B6C381|nr:hypothetical protein [Streptomyces sp. SID13726]NEB01989.1 hypothetical protein [Streptomyces sp. SID13726]